MFWAPAFVVETSPKWLTAKSQCQTGDQTRTILNPIGIRCDDALEDLSEGIAIGSGFMLDEETQVEAVRYPKGSDVMGLTATLMTHSTPGWRRFQPD